MMKLVIVRHKLNERSLTLSQCLSYASVSTLQCYRLDGHFTRSFPRSAEPIQCKKKKKKRAGEKVHKKFSFLNCNGFFHIKFQQCKYPPGGGGGVLKLLLL